MSDDDSSVHGDVTGESDDAIRTRYDWNTATPSTAVAETVAMATGSEPNEIEPLYDHIDPDSLDALVSPRMVSRLEATNSVTFQYESYEVTVRSNGEITVQDDGSREQD